jgi:hypothetical protein
MSVSPLHPMPSWTWARSDKTGPRGGFHGQMLKSEGGDMMEERVFYSNQEATWNNFMLGFLLIKHKYGNLSSNVYYFYKESL